MQTYCVYVHKKSTDGSIFYVGKGKGKKRAYAKSSRTELWKRTEAKHGRTVHIVFDGLSNEDACALESLIILQIERKNLVNFTNGGEGAPGRAVSEKTREAVRLKNKGKPPSRQTIESAIQTTSKPVTTLCGLRFKSITEAAKYVMPQNWRAAKINISSCCNGVRGQTAAYGFQFRFEVNGSPYEKNHLKEKKIFNSLGVSFCSPKDAGEWCEKNGLTKNKISAAGNVVSALQGRLQSAYGVAWWRKGDEPKEYIAPFMRRSKTIKAKRL